MISDAAVRERALDPTSSFIVQAPAGSGKTELLTQRYLCLLARVQQPEQILAITFTRKAAAEMRNRIAEAIAAAAGPEPQAPHKRQTWRLARAVREADARHGWGLAEHASRLRIQTIDALNSLLARRLPILAGTGAAMEPADDAGPLYEAAASALIEHLGDGSDVSASLERLIMHLGNRVDLLVQLLRELLAKRDQWLHPIMSASAHANLRDALEHTLAHVIEHHLAELSAHMSVAACQEYWELACFAADNLLSDPALKAQRRVVLEACQQRGHAPGADCDSFAAWLALAQVFVKEDGAPYRSVTVRQGFPTTHKDQKKRMQEALAELAEDPQLVRLLEGLRTLPTPHYSDAQWDILQALLDVLPLAVAELKLAFQAAGQADYIESALRALQAMGTSEQPTDLALAFDHRLQHLLVDEFQDTSYGQLDLLERLTAEWYDGDGRTLFCVGDPMQSIYRFRQAEVGLFLQLQRHGLHNIRLEPLQLQANFRSTRPVINWLNAVFPQVLAQKDDAERGAVRYTPSVAAADGDEGGVRVHPSLVIDAAAESQQVVALVRAALAADDHSRVAILVTARTHVGRIARDLHAAGIAFQAVEIESLLQRPVVQDLIALTRALVHLADRTAWLAVLRAPWCGLSLADLHRIVGDDRRASVNTLLEQALASTELPVELRQRVQPVFEVLQAALAERGRWPLREWVERAWNALGGPATVQRQQDLDDAEAFLTRIESLSMGSDLDDVARLELHLAKLFANPRPQSAVRVEVMTIHKAKGLEFEVVILPGLHRWLRGESKELLRWVRIPGEDGGIVFAPVQAQGDDADPMYRWIEQQEVERSLSERGRLLYVAATRAKRELHLLGSVGVREKDNELSLQLPRKGTMLQMLWHEVESAFLDKLSQTLPVRSVIQTQVTQQLRRLPLQWQAPTADAPLLADTMVDDSLEAQSLDFDWVSQTSRHVGTLVHRELERLVRTGVDASQWLASIDLEARLACELGELGVPAEHCDAGVQRVLAAVEQTLADTRGRWLLGLDGSISGAESELALTGVLDGEVRSAVIDRTFVDEAGVRWIVDFKTSSHEGGGLDDFLDEELRRYRPQLLRYARLLRLLHPQQSVKAALYFPLLRQWRELSLNA